MDIIHILIRIIPLICAIPVVLIICLSSKRRARDTSSPHDRLKKLIEDRCCPNCRQPMQPTQQANQLYYSCPKHCLYYVIRTEPKHYKSNYFDERETEKRFKITAPFVWGFGISERHYDSDVGTETGVVSRSNARNIEKAFDELRTKTLVDIPITEDKFRQAIADGKQLIEWNKCPLCETFITKKTNFVKGYGDNVTKMVKTGYGEYTFKTEYVGTYDSNVVTYTCGCGINFSLNEGEIDGMFYKKYSTTASDDRLQRACAFSEIYSKKKTWYTPNF